MKINIILNICLCMIVIHSTHTMAVELYVSTNGISLSPFTNWYTAATQIQTAVDASSDGDVVWVGPGTYDQGSTTNSVGRNRIAISKAIVVRSSEGPQATIILGQRGDITTQVRCAWLNTNAHLSGFTLLNGGAQSGDGWFAIGGGIFMDQKAEVDNCIVNNCIAYNGGGIAGTTYPSWDGNDENICIVSNSFIVGNYGTENGGGAIGVKIINSIIESNTAYSGGGFANCIADRCIIRWNYAHIAGGAIGTDEWPGKAILINSIIAYNGATVAAGLYTVTALNAYNCTVLDGSREVALVNCLLWKPMDLKYSTLTSCLYTNNPYTFIDKDNFDYRLHPLSPAIDAGLTSNLPDKYYHDADLRGYSRYVGQEVDVGAYEFQGERDGRIPASWLALYSLPTNQTINFNDPDSDGYNTWEEYVTFTDPTNHESYFIITDAKYEGTRLVEWAGYSNRYYTLESEDTVLGPWRKEAVLQFNGEDNIEYIITNINPLLLYRLMVEIQ